LDTQNENMKKGGEAGKKPKVKIPKGNKPAIIVLSTLAGTVAVVGGILIYTVLSGREPEQNQAPRDIIGGRGMLMTEDNYEEVFDSLVQPADDSHYLVNMSMDLAFDTWSMSSRDTFIRNDARNLRTIYVDLYLDNEDGSLGELIYSSPYIPVGRELNNFSLDREVTAGYYSATLVYNLVDDEYEHITELVLGVRLIIRE